MGIWYAATMTCGRCGEVDVADGRKYADANDAEGCLKDKAKEEGWRYSLWHGWVCPECQERE